MATEVYTIIYSGRKVCLHDKVAAGLRCFSAVSHRTGETAACQSILILVQKVALQFHTDNILDFQ